LSTRGHLRGWKIIKHSSEIENFQKLFAQAAEEGIRETLGNSAANGVLSEIKSLFPNDEDVLKKPKKFDEGLRKLYGEGAKIFEKRILAKLFEKGIRTADPFVYAEGSTQPLSVRR